MKILAIGDIVSKQGCEYLRDKLFGIKREYGADFVIANGENSAIGNGILPQSAKFIFDSGVDVITLGNHALRRPEITDYLEENECIIRPANYHKSAPGRGMVLLDKGAVKIAVINLQGAVYLDNIENPFDAADREVAFAKKEGADIILMDFHAEASSEKRAMGFYLDGKISALFGTHTHVQTSDATVLPGGTAFISDLGMTGPWHSSIGRQFGPVLQKLMTGIPARFEVATGPSTLEGAVITFDPSTRLATAIAPFRYREPLN